MWDGSGNMTMQQLNTDNGVLERALCWDEENRLAATRDEIYLTHNSYDASGTRVWKIAAEANYMWFNGNLYASGDLNLRTLYQSEYTTITDVGYTKHYYIEGQRIASKLGGGFSGMGETDLGGDESTISANLEPIDREIDALGERFWSKMMRDFTCVGINGENLNMDRQLPAIDNLLKRDDTEHDLYFYHGDHLGSSSYITDINGDATQHMQYLPFGEDFIHEQNATSYYTPYTFSAKERDLETQYSYFGARYYDAGLSIWLSVDPMSDKAPDWTPYRYSFQNPVKYIDPNGLFEDEATATAARDKAVQQYGKGRVTDVYYNEKKKEWGFGVSASDDQQTNSVGTDGVSTTTHSKTSGVYNEDFLKEGGTTKSLSLSFAFGGGYSIKFGKVFDQKGGSRSFFSHGPTVGLSLGISMESTTIIPNSDNPLGFSVDEYAGSSAGYSVGYGTVAVSVSGTFDRTGGSPASEFMRVPMRAGYTEYGGGPSASRGLNVGGQWSQTKTKLR